MDTAAAKRAWTALKGIGGWFSYEAAMLFAITDRVQQEDGVRGHIFEIGSHHGRSTVLLVDMLSRTDEKLVICDLFDDQAANVSASGKGDFAIFERNVMRRAPSSDSVVIHRKLSQDLSADDLGMGYRFLHIDGGHNADEALADLELCASVMVPGGAMLIDDILRVEWPGVTEAVVRFLDARPEFTPVVIGFNKLLIVRADDAERYRSRFRDRGLMAAYGVRFPWQTKLLPFVGHDVLIYYVHSSDQRITPRTLAKRVYHGLRS